MPDSQPTCHPPHIRADRMVPESAFAVLAEARALEAAGREIIHLEIGQPDVPPPAHVLRALEESLWRGEVGYTEPGGLPRLRRTIAATIADAGGHQTPDDIVVTPGGKAALHLAIASLVGEGEPVAVPDPGFSPYSALVHNAGAEPVPYRVGRDEGETLASLESVITPATRVAILNFPHNPTGQVLSAAGRERLAALALRHDLTLVSDEVYGALQYDGEFRSLVAVPGLAERTVVVNSLSKSHAVPGFRLGWLAVPPGASEVADRAERIAVNTFGCVAPFIQSAGVAALDGPQTVTEALRELLAARAACAGDRLTECPGVSWVAPAGGLYLFVNITDALPDDRMPVSHVAAWLLRNEGVAVLPGTAFGPGGAGHLRISLAASAQHLAEGIARIGRGLGHLAAGEAPEAVTA